MTDPPRRVRADVLLVQAGRADTREKAQALILSGAVRLGARRIDKPGALVPRDAELTVAATRRYVGRGALKLGPALAAFGVVPAGRVALDVGASTGGFTQVLLEAGAAQVVALDVGRGQLDWSLRNDPRVVLREGINARYLALDQLPERPSLATVDVSFISLRQVLEPVCACLAEGGDVVALVKPQFEVGRDRVGRGGIVRDPALWIQTLDGIAAFARERGLGPRSIVRSSVPGAEGNVEFFVHLRPGEPAAAESDLALRRTEAIRGPEA